MKKIFIIPLLCCVFGISCRGIVQETDLSTELPEGAQARSKLGKILYPPAANQTALENYAIAKKEYDANPNDAEKLIWYGRRTAYLGDYREAINIYSEGISKFPSDARFYRHRGHRNISIREFDKAIIDFETAAKLVEGTIDRIEPDGQPNAYGIPISSLHSNINYHLGLSYYLTNDLEKALKVYQRDVARASNDDKVVSTTHWLYMTLRLLGRDAEAREALEPINKEMKIIENMVYHQLCLFYKGELSLGELQGDDFTDVMNDAMAYGIGNWHYYNGDLEKAKAVYERILSEGAWASFGFIAAEADYVRSFSK